jgi:hypothetical protein
MQNLINAINRIIPEDTTKFSSIPEESTLDFSDHWDITHALEEFETVLGNELPTLDTYIVSKKGIYSTADLVDRAEMAIDESARAHIRKELIEDFKQAGKCLAFELPTAAGFHTMRATEGVLRDYWYLVRNPSTGTTAPEMAICINELRANGEDPKLMDILDHIRDLHRNTLMHPEAFLTMKEALRLFDISKSAISAMADRIGELKQPATNALAGILTHRPVGIIPSMNSPLPPVSAPNAPANEEVEEVQETQESEAGQLTARSSS